MATEKIGEGFNKDERENSGRINVTFILLMTFYHGRSVKSEFSTWKIEGLDFQWLSPHLPLLLLLACVQLNQGSYFSSGATFCPICSEVDWISEIIPAKKVKLHYNLNKCE